MKPTLALLLSFVLGYPLSMSAQAAKSPPPAGATMKSPPAQESSSYRDEAAKLVLNYPADFAPQPAAQALLDQEKSKRTGAMHSLVGCLTLPLMTARMSEDLALLAYARVDSDCMGAKLPPEQIASLATSTLRGSIAQMGAGSMPDPPVTTTISGHSAAIQYGNVELKGMGIKLYGAVICLSVDGSVGCVEQMASTPEALKKLGKLTIQFDGQQPVPLIADGVIAPAAAPSPKP